MTFGLREVDSTCGRS